MNVILLSGKAESGKTLTSKTIKRMLEAKGLRVVKLAYGDYVKETAKIVFGWDGNKDEAGRELLQRWGTDIVRSKHPDFWAETIKRLVEVLTDEFDCVVIDDARFENEIHIWDSSPVKLITARVERPGHQNMLTPEQRLHGSETALDDFDFDVRLIATDKQVLEAEIESKLIPLVVGVQK